MLLDVPSQTLQNDTPILPILLYLVADQCSSPRRLVVRNAVAGNKQINLEPALVQHPYPINILLVSVCYNSVPD